MSLEECEHDIIELQARVAFQEDMLQQLNDTIADQDQIIRALMAKLKRWESRLDEMAYAMESGGKLSEPPPPHY